MVNGGGGSLVEPPPVPSLGLVLKLACAQARCAKNRSDSGDPRCAVVQVGFPGLFPVKSSVDSNRPHDSGRASGKIGAQWFATTHWSVVLEAETRARHNSERR
jgi:hypothetical protein